jgi:pyrimidine-nucleoside phosphorylase
LALTRAMTSSGDILSWPEGPPLVDKHSTGGVGDKVSLVLAPLWAELGLRVPMISGRGLGHTGGTLDKLEAIPGYRTDLSVAALGAVLGDVGCFISGQTAELAPADRVLYALRNEIQAVESIPLIVGSILSKKLAEGIERLVLDVKTGSGAFMATFEGAERLARAMVQVANGYGVQSVALITAMDQPLGAAVGNALEVVEAAECLRGGGPADLRDLTVALARHPAAAEVLASGRAYPRFLRMVEAQGGDPRAVDDPRRLHGGGTAERPVEAPRAGYVERVDARGVGRAAFLLGAGRRRAEDPVDAGVGVRVGVREGDAVERGQILATLYHREGRALDEALSLLGEAIVIGDRAIAPVPLVRRVID